MTDLKTDSFAVFGKDPLCDDRTTKILQTCVGFTYPCINLPVRSAVTREYPLMYLNLSTCCIVLPLTSGADVGGDRSP